MNPTVSLLLDDLFKDTVAVFDYFVVNLAVKTLCRDSITDFKCPRTLDSNF